MEIYNLAKDGKTSELAAKLQEPGVKDINFFHFKDQRTPLGIAVFRRDLKTAELLLAHNADPNGLKRGRPPLWTACERTKTKYNVEEHLIQLLLDHGADPNVPSAIASDKGSTPLVKAVQTRKSLQTISRLVNHGADTSKAAKLREAENDPEVLNAMQPRSKRTLSRLSEVSKVVGFVLAVVFWANRNLIVAIATGAAVGGGMIVKDAIKKRFSFTGAVSDRQGKYIKGSDLFDDTKEHEKAKLKGKMHGIIKETNLGRFFPDDNPFLEKLVDRAVDLEQNDPTNSLPTTDLCRLALYQPVLYCDDSGSMRKGQRKGHLEELSKRITSITTRVVPDGEGIELRFINAATTPEMSKPSLEAISGIMKGVRFDGWTQIGTNLKKKVLDEIVYRQLDSNIFKRPVLVSVITDGEPTGAGENNNTFKDVILECGRRLKAKGYDPDVVQFQISQIGEDQAAEHFLDSLKEEIDLADVLYITSDRLDTQFAKLRNNEDHLEQWLLEILLGPILDAQPS
ncbi:hypothetical protein BJX68DRAFT_263032 [Aspergillus pseudodeflectus]|uniref:Ankyrin repeat-containing domain protein n=1 Tax=Aspergillus pseudodeflectus TaxID=176178 RepID=A0ABR4KYX4_9EURO